MAFELSLKGWVGAGPAELEGKGLLRRETDGKRKRKIVTHGVSPVGLDRWVPEGQRGKSGGRLGGARSRNVMDKGQGHSVQGFWLFIWWKGEDQWGVN